LKKVIEFIKKVFRWIFNLIFFLFAISIATVIIYRFVPPPFTPLMLIRCYEKGSFNIHKDYVSLDKISPDLALALVAGEDNNFLIHDGFDFEAIKKAVKFNEEHKKKTIGASTISQQTAKNVFLWNGRTYLRKGLEVYFTVLIETFWNKKRIMELYLNEIEMGDGIYGAETASRTYFKKPAKDLTRKEAAMIAAIVPNPLHWSPINPNATVNYRQEVILWNMNNIMKVDYDKPVKPVVPPMKTGTSANKSK
jgi:monofunctional biosynthetic peptidoglycan transglycosylase